MIRNTRQNYGWLAIALHWLMALVIVGLFGLGFYMVELTYYDPLYKRLPDIHKSIGILLAILVSCKIPKHSQFVAIVSLISRVS